MRSHAPGWVLMAGLVLFLSAGLAQATQNFNFNCLPRAVSVPTGQFYQFQVPISAVAPGADSVDVYFEARYPNGWFSQWCQSSTGICFIDDQVIRLSVGEADSLEIDFFPAAGVPGMGWAQITVRSRVDPLDYAQCTYTLYSGMPVAHPSYVINCSDNIRRLSAGTFVQFNSPMRNTATGADELIVIMETQLPPGWFAQFCQSSNGICFIDEGLLSMPPSVQDTLQVDFFLTGTTGTGVADIRIHSASNPSVVTYCHYQVFLNQGTTGAPEPVVTMTRETRSWAEPNPFASGTTLRLRTEADGPAELSIFGADGRLIRNLPGLRLEPGDAQIRWDGLTEAGTAAPSGVYYYRIRTAGQESRGVLVRTR